MSMFLESPWPIINIGVILEIVLAIAMAWTRRGVILWAMFGVLVLTGAGLIVERLVVTDNEQISDTLYECAKAAEVNDVGRVLACISPSAKKTRGDIQFVFGRFEVQMARLSNIEIKINRLTSPPSARVKFRVIGRGRDRQGVMVHEAFAEDMAAIFQLENGRWAIAGYTAEGIDVR